MNSNSPRRRIELRLTDDQIRDLIKLITRFPQSSFFTDGAGLNEPKIMFAWKKGLQFSFAHDSNELALALISEDKFFRDAANEYVRLHKEATNE